MRFVVASIVSFAFAVALPSQSDEPDFAAFREEVGRQLRGHAFFSRITFTMVERPPFLFCVERPAVDDADYDLAVVNSYLPYLRELLDRFEADYRTPLKLRRRPEAGGYALAVLGSAGRYVDFRTAIGEPSLAMARAHYTPELRLAVTYQDTFARGNTKGEERHALLHEFVHALQHAYSVDGSMPRPVWFNEGLADYRASCGNTRASLRQPPLQDHHVQALAFGYGNPAGRFYVAPIEDLVLATSYAQVVELANRRNKAEVPSKLLLSMFYAQSEMFVRFLHEGENNKHREGFLRYLKAAQAGESGRGAFMEALALADADALKQLDLEWRRWLTEVLRRRHPKLRDLTKSGADAEADAAPLSPPRAFDASGLAWTVADFDDRLAGARRLCADGHYEAAIRMLPTDGDTPEGQLEAIRRERWRVAELVRVRDRVLADLLQRKGRLSLKIDGDGGGTRAAC